MKIILATLTLALAGVSAAHAQIFQSTVVDRSHDRVVYAPARPVYAHAPVAVVCAPPARVVCAPAPRVVYVQPAPRVVYAAPRAVVYVPARPRTVVVQAGPGYGYRPAPVICASAVWR